MEKKDFLVLNAKRMIAAGMLAFALAQAAAAAGWSSYGNARFGYSIDIPPGFSAIVEADNSDGGTSTATDGHATLRVWGGYIMQDSFAGEIAWSIDQDKSDGWTISYEKRGGKAASWSGTKGDRVFYERAVVGCDGAAAYFNLEYDRSAIKVYDKVVGRLVKSLTGCAR